MGFLVMTPSDFVRSIYLGDRACKAILIDGGNASVRVAEAEHHETLVRVTGKAVHLEDAARPNVRIED